MGSWCVLLLPQEAINAVSKRHLATQNMCVALSLHVQLGAVLLRQENKYNKPPFCRELTPKRLFCLPK